jgi:tRNA modification GTPase
MLLTDTIAAIATPIGEGGLAVIRISGGDAIAVAGRVFQAGGKQAPALAEVPTHTVHYGHIVRDDRRVDEVLLTVLRAPRTFTREDTVEISCHGGVLVTRLVLETVLAAGVRLAEPGEFTQRAFLNGRIDLTQAEAVADLIHARTELALGAAHEQLAGKLAGRINQLRDDLMKVLAHVEAHLDFPDEDIAPDTQAELLRRLEVAGEFVDELLHTAREGQILRRGIRAAIVGRPNAGKSSLLNQLLGRDRAIVSPLAGTTRDTVEETANVRGIPVVFVDTAGLRDALDVIEAEGVKRSRAALASAELILHVLDQTEPLAPEDEELARDLGDRPRLVVCNKADLPAALVLPESWKAVSVACTSGVGVESLKDSLAALVWSGAIAGEHHQLTVNARHAEALRRAKVSLEQARLALAEGVSLECVAFELRVVTGAVGEIVGKTTTDDLLDSIFGQFCLGK